MKRILPLLIISSILLIPACGGKGKKANALPDDFNSLSDAKKVEYIMANAPADSVARFIIFAALGKVEGVRIDSLNQATLAAYETYTDTALQTFSWEFDRVAEELPLHDKMRLRMLVGAEDPQGLGLTLGLEYLNQIRIKEMTPDEVAAELRELKKACREDPDLYARFLIGFQTVLRYDKNADMPKEIYSRFENFDREAVDQYYSRNKSVAPNSDDPQLDSTVIFEPEEADSVEA